MSVKVLGSFSVGEVNVSAAGALAALNPLLAQFDLVVTTGLGSVLGDISAQLSAAISMQAQVALQVANPLAALQESLRAAIALVAELQATIALGVPVIAAQASASAGAAAALAARVGALQALIQAALAVKIPAVSFAGAMAGHMNAGPVVLLSIGAEGADTLASAGQAIAAQCQSGAGGIQPSNQVYGLLLLTSAPSAWAALGATMRAA